MLGAFAWLAGARSAGAAGPNLFLITIDTLRADHVGRLWRDDAVATPALDALAARGVRFDQAQTAAPLTGPSHATILTGQYPPTHGVRGNVVFTLGDRYPTLATLLKRRGYRTAAFVGAYPVAAAFGFGQGFDTFDEEFHESSPGEPGGERRANEVADAAVRWLHRPPRERGAVLHLAAFLRSACAVRSAARPIVSASPAAPYDGEVAFTDAQIGRVLEALRASGHDARHHRRWCSPITAKAWANTVRRPTPCSTYQSTMRVPFVVAGPGVPAGANGRGARGDDRRRADGARPARHRARSVAARARSAAADERP